MKYTVTFTAFAEYQLADIWLRARNRQAVTQAADYLDTLLRTDADQVVAFEEEMRAAKADWQVIQYGNTLHSFTNPEADGSLNPAILYNEKTDKRSWAAMRDFFQEKFGA